MRDDDDIRGSSPLDDRPPGRNGSSLDECGEYPVDPAAVRADDALIDVVSGELTDAGIDRLFELVNATVDREAPDVDMDRVIATAFARHEADLARMLDVEAGLTRVLLAWRRDVRGTDDGDPDGTVLAAMARALPPTHATHDRVGGRVCLRLRSWWQTVRGVHRGCWGKREP